MSIVDSAVDTDGRRTEFCSLQETRQACRIRDGFAWIDLHEPTEEEFDLVTCEFDLHELAVEDAIEALQDHALRVTEQIEGFRDLLTNILNVNLTLVGADQNDQTKKISAWAAILIVPTIVTGIYGMNFDQIPELHWTLGYPLSLALIVLLSTLLYRGFKRSGWL